MKLFDDEFYTHMPFVFEDKLIHCKAKDRFIGLDKGTSGTSSKYQAYDIYASDLDGSNSFYIGANFDEKVIACSPNAFRNNQGEVVLNYVACDMSSGSMRYYHYQRKGESLQSLGAHKRIIEPNGIPQHCQTENSRFSYTVYQSLDNSYLMQYDKLYNTSRKIMFKNMSILKRAVVFEEHSVILTYTNKQSVTKSALFRTNDNYVKDIKVNGNDIYKSHLHNGIAYYSVRSVGDTYGMAIYSDEYTLVASDLQ